METHLRSSVPNCLNVFIIIIIIIIVIIIMTWPHHRRIKKSRKPFENLSPSPVRARSTIYLWYV